jgi:predicted nucleic acid-binding protein
VIAYVDSSALVKLFLDEHDSDVARAMWDSGVPLTTSRVSHPELACALAAAVRSGRDSRSEVCSDVVDGSFLQRASFVEVDEVLVKDAAVVGVRHGLSGLDAIHVASAVKLSDFAPVFVSWDERQRRAAFAEGLAVYPEETTTAALR